MLALVLSALLQPPVLPPPPTPAGPGPADAVAAAVDLSWTTPPQCPDATLVRDGIAGLLGEATDPAAAAEVHVVAAITVDGAAYRLDLRVETPSGQTTKTMTAGRCEVLVDATALITAIAIDPSAVLEATEPVQAPQPDVAPPEDVSEPAPPPAPAPAPVAEPASRPPGTSPPPEPRTPSRVPLVRFAMQAAGGLDIATLPGVSGSVSALGAVFGARWRAEVLGIVLFPRTALATAGAGARVALFAAGARGCWVPTAGPVELPLCGGGEAGALRGEPVGERVINRQTEFETYLAGLGSFGIGWAPRPYLALVGRGELVVPLLRPGFAVGEQLAHRPASASGRFFAGIEARFP